MTYEQRKQERQALIEPLLAQDWNVLKAHISYIRASTLNALEIVYGTSPTDDITAPCFTRYAHLKVFETLVFK